MRLLLSVLLLLFVCPNITWTQTRATLKLNDNQFFCESYLVEGNYYFYSPEVILLKKVFSPIATLEFQFPYQGKIITQANYKKHQLNLELNYPKEILSIIAKPTKDKKIQLKLEFKGSEERTDSLNIHLTDKKDSIIAKYCFPIELTTNPLLAFNGEQNNTGNDQDNNDPFSKAPLIMMINNMQDGSSVSYRVDSILTLPLKKDTDGYYFFIKASPESASSELIIQTQWIGKGLRTNYIRGSRFRFIVKPEETDQSNKKWERSFLASNELIEFVKPLKSFRPARVDFSDDEEVDDVYTLQIQFKNEEKINTKTIKFYILK